LQEIPAVVTLRAVWLKQYHRTVTHGRREVAWRRTKTSRPADNGSARLRHRCRYATKRGSGWQGYKIHLTETCDDAATTGLPHLVTNVAATDATVTDVERLEQITPIWTAATSCLASTSSMRATPRPSCWSVPA